jgi:subtilisin family serine protease
MKIKKLSQLLVGFGLLVGVLTISSLLAEEAPPAGFSRVYINIESGSKGAVVSAVAGVGGNIHYEFDSIGAIAATVPDQALGGLSRSAGVLAIEPDPQRFLTAEIIPYGITDVQAPTAVSAGADGSGVMVGVIDSGIYPAHEDFEGVTLSGYPEEISVTIRGGGKPRTETTPLGPDDEAYWGRDFFGHGTHVSGTITAVGANGTGVVGVSPGNVKIHMVKVFGDSGAWIYSSTLVDAAQRASAAGAKIINMSLGGPVPSSTEESGMDQLESQGILLVAASGNDGSTSFHYPASYDSVLSVGAVDSSKVVADFSQKNSQVELVAPGVWVASTVPYFDDTSVISGAGTFEANDIEFSALTTGLTDTLVSGGLATSTDTTNWSGKIVLVERGTNSFYEKVSNVESSGGIAAIIYNNEPGNFLGTLGDGNSSGIPAVSVSQADGASLLGEVGNNVTVINDFTIPFSGYEEWSGTSMATPHVAGVAALLWSAYPNASNQNIRDAMTQTAMNLGVAGRDDSYGYGLVQAHDALLALPDITSIIADPGDGGSGDTVGPVISNVADTDPSKNGSFDITWGTDVAATSNVYLDGFGWYDNSELVTSHKRKFRGTKGAIYLYSVSSTDASGNTTVDDNNGSYYEHQN